MAKLCLRKTSKRVPLRKKYKIQKKVREHNRKKRREAKKNPKKGAKDDILQIPNLYPFKEAMLKEAAALKQKKEEEQRAKIAARKEAKKLEKKTKKEAAAVERSNLNVIVQEAEQKQKVHEQMDSETMLDNGENKIQEKTESMQKYYREFKKVIEESNIVLQILDSRDPNGTRSKHVEDCVLQSAGKRLVLVLNKADLIPQENLKKWLKHLKQFFPTVPFKANTQQQKKKLSQRKHFKKLPQAALEGSKSVGADLLMSLLANYCRNNDIKQSITVGVVGMPNVGKSSIINSLKRSRSCNVGAIPGLTKKMQEVQLDSKIKLIDSPGIVYVNEEGDENRNALKNAARPENLLDPIGAASAILLKVNKDQMKEQYKLQDYSTVDEFFCVLAKRLGAFRKGGVPDALRAARHLINDWNRGRIRHYTEPPEEGNEAHVDAQIVQTMAKEFDISSFEAMETNVIESLEGSQKKVIQNDAPRPSMEVEVEGTPNELLGEAPILISELVKVEEKKTKKQRWKKKKNVKEKADKQLQLEGNQKLNKVKKLLQKKMKKEKARRVKETSKLADTLSSVSLGTSQKKYEEDYDFADVGLK